MDLTAPFDVAYARSHFPAFAEPSLVDLGFFENAGGSYACRQTIEALRSYYVKNKVQPYGAYEPSRVAGDQMDRSHARWAQALGTDPEDIHFGPSTSMNAYVLARAFAELIGAGDEIIVTNQDHEANTGAIRRMAETARATTLEWQVDPDTGLLDAEGLGALLSSRTRLVTFPHASNIVGQENDVQLLAAMAHESGARVIVDGVSFAPHTIPDLGQLNPDVYLFSLYKTYSVHQGLMAVRNGLIDDLPNQGHYFNATLPGKRLTPAGPDHAQEAAAGAVLDYIEDLAAHHGVGGPLRAAAGEVSRLWRDHESALLEPLMTWLVGSGLTRVLGPTASEGGLHRCPTVSFVPHHAPPAAVADDLAARGIAAGAGHFYARRLVEALGVEPASGVVRVSWVHYTTAAEVTRLIESLDVVLRP